ncbi:3550_t:CDS:2 [Ambispora gerdemannii]|uniref:3550_t:CDS:1 n=1 Tax=Ambispora gerdemannii TaxID=144530 RepID=A0A9N9CFI1_9GLOM|nr:3550_t:CDS:2 [Ambispora gerdemannii]
MSVVYKEISRLTLSSEDKTALRVFLTNNQNTKEEVDAVLITIENDDEKINYLKNFLQEQGKQKRNKGSTKKLELDITTPSQEMVRFINELSNIQLDVNDKFLILPDNVCFEGKSHYRSNLFIQQCYRDLAKIILEIVNGGSKDPYFMIHDNPGIGKTYFVYYLLHLLLQHDNTIVWEKSRNVSQAVLITGPKNALIIQKAHLKHLEKKNICKGIAETSSLRGNLFEGYSHNLIRRGHFRISSLNTSLTADEIVSIQETEFESYGKVDEIINTVPNIFHQNQKHFVQLTRSFLQTNFSK